MTVPPRAKVNLSATCRRSTLSTHHKTSDTKNNRHPKRKTKRPSLARVAGLTKRRKTLSFVLSKSFPVSPQRTHLKTPALNLCFVRQNRDSDPVCGVIDSLPVVSEKMDEISLCPALRNPLRHHLSRLCGFKSVSLGDGENNQKANEADEAHLLGDEGQENMKQGGSAGHLWLTDSQGDPLQSHTPGWGAALVQASQLFEVDCEHAVFPVSISVVWRTDRDRERSSSETVLKEFCGMWICGFQWVQTCLKMFSCVQGEHAKSNFSFHNQIQATYGTQSKILQPVYLSFLTDLSCRLMFSKESYLLRVLPVQMIFSSPSLTGASSWWIKSCYCVVKLYSSVRCPEIFDLKVSFYCFSQTATVSVLYLLCTSLSS